MLLWYTYVSVCIYILLTFPNSINSYCFLGLTWRRNIWLSPGICDKLSHEFGKQVGYIGYDRALAVAENANNESGNIVGRASCDWLLKELYLSKIQTKLTALLEDNEYQTFDNKTAVD